MQYFCMDVYYEDNYAVSAGILFDNLTSDECLLEQTITVENIEPYESGRFYKRELPCLIKLIDSLPELPSIFIVDSFVHLDNDKKKGLGAYLYEYYQNKIPVIGVAKNDFKENSSSEKVFRGESKKSLYITSIGIEQNVAADMIQKMHGDYRLPTLLKKVDNICRGKE